MLAMITHVASTPSINVETFNPTKWVDNEEEHLCWSWFTDPQLKQFLHNGEVSGYKQSLHGDSVHHQTTASIWQCIVGGPQRTKAISAANRLANGMYSSSIYFRRAEDISIELVPNHIEANANNAGPSLDRRRQCSISKEQWDNPLVVYGTLTNGSALTMRHRRQFGLIIQSVLGHNRSAMAFE
eukprot:1360838-Amphidinium_carterae.2